MSEEVNEKITEQVKARVFPIQLRAGEWNSGEINWLFDVIALDHAMTARVIANFRQVVNGGDLRLHPMIGRLVHIEALTKLRRSGR
ncbi:MAG: hypothetical protein ABJL99_04220 [Aliishimia sp.]